MNGDTEIELTTSNWIVLLTFLSVCGRLAFGRREGHPGLHITIHPGLHITIHPGICSFEI